MTIWQGSLPRWKYVEAIGSQLQGKTATTALLAIGLERDGTVFSFVNNTDKEIEVMMVNPDDVNQVKYTFVKVSPGFGFHSETLNAGGIFGILAGTKIYLHSNNATAVDGKFRIFVWG